MGHSRMTHLYIILFVSQGKTLKILIIQIFIIYQTPKVLQKASLGCLIYFLNSKISPGWQSRVSQIASKVEKRIALIFPVFIFERFTLAIPTFSESSFSDILRSAITLSSLKIIGTLILLIMFRQLAVEVLHHI